ncbi:MAG: response regulator [Candidatus Rokuibacteriota bacterium]
MLVVDDDRAITLVLAQILTADGLEVETAFDGLAALDKVATRPFDVIVSDLRMPRLDGLGLYQALVERNPSMAKRVIFMTGDVIDREARVLLESGSVPMLAKPFDINELRRAVKANLTR